MLRACVLLVSLFLFFASPAKAAIIHSFDWDDDYKAYGATFESVLFGEGFDSNGVGRVRFTGVLVAPNWVLTAAHVANNPLLAGGSIGFGTGPNFISDRGFVQSFGDASSNFFSHPDYVQIGIGPDLALVHFENPFPVNPATLFAGQPSVGMDVSMVGYGRVGEPGGSTIFDGSVRGGEGVLNSISLNGDLLSRFVESGHPNYRQLGLLGAPGDSGGGWFIDVDGEFQLAGIFSTSAAVQGFNNYNFNSVASSVDIPWVQSYTSTAVPEPGTFALFGLAAGTFALRRMRNRKKCS
jgi:hypothetical protein